MYANPYNQYKHTAIETASPERLIIMLYDAAIKSLRQAKEAIEAKKIEEANNLICKAQRIVTELLVSLDMSVGEISHNLFNLYEYWNRRIVEANIRKDVAILVEVFEQMEQLRDAWAEAIKKCKETQARVVGGVNIEG